MNRTVYPNTHDDGKFLFRRNNSGESMRCVIAFDYCHRLNKIGIETSLLPIPSYIDGVMEGFFSATSNFSLEYHIICFGLLHRWWRVRFFSLPIVPLYYVNEACTIGLLICQRFSIVINTNILYVECTVVVVSRYRNIIYYILYKTTDRFKSESQFPQCGYWHIVTVANLKRTLTMIVLPMYMCIHIGISTAQINNTTYWNIILFTRLFTTTTHNDDDNPKEVTAPTHLLDWVRLIVFVLRRIAVLWCDVYFSSRLGIYRYLPQYTADTASIKMVFEVHIHYINV